MPHDAHFLERLDRVRADETDLALGLYRDHELVRFVLSHAKLEPGADRVAIALADGGDGPWIVVARSGAFVTCLGKGMTPNGLAVVSRAQLDGWSEKHEDVRRRVAIARERGALDRRFIKHVLAAGRWLSREDFLALSAVAAPLAGSFFRTYFDTYEVVTKGIGALAFAPPPRGDKQRLVFTQLARASWSMGHLALAMVEGADREWLRVVCDTIAAAKEIPAWLPLYEQLAIPFVTRAAWCSAKLGKLALPGCKAEHARPRTTGVELFESGYALLAIGIRHAGLRAEAFKALRGSHVEGETPWVREMRPWIANIATIFEQGENRTSNDALAFGRLVFHGYRDDFPEGSKYRFADAESVPEDLARTAALNEFHNGAYDRKWMPMAATLVTLAARAKAEEFYYPADVYREISVDRTYAEGLALARMHRARTDVPTPVRVEATPGRNEPCSCGSGKKYKKCCGGAA